MDIKTILKEIGISKEPEKVEDGYYSIPIKDSNEYGIYYSKLEKSNLVDLDDDSSVLTYESSSLQYIGDEFLITLIADFEENVYKLTIKDLNKNTNIDNTSREDELDTKEEINIDSSEEEIE